MKVILVNGGPHPDGCTNLALEEIEKTLNENNIETEKIWLGNKAIGGCIACNHCLNTNNRCFMDDKVNEFLKKVETTDGFVFGSPVHFAGASGALTSFLDRAFYGRGSLFAGKVCASVVSCRRGGASSAFDQINKYATISNMPLVSSQYWNMVHGFTPEDVKKDLEGMQTMRVLGRNMAWLLKCIELGKENNINRPELEERVATNFID